MDKIFLDAAYAIALASTNDRNHKKAVILAKEIEDRGRQMVTTYAVIFEIGNSLAKLRYRQAAVDLIDSIEKDPNIEIIPISERLHKRAFDLYRERMDKEWGLTDCISFIVMKDLGIREALTADEHFQQNGFHALLRPA